MIYNESLVKSYGTFQEITEYASVVASKRNPSQNEYDTGYMNRTFVKKINENLIVEVAQQGDQNINPSLYKVLDVSWKITGPRNNIYKNGILDKAGVVEQNKFEIDRIKSEQGVDLSSTLVNLLEYWAGR